MSNVYNLEPQPTAKVVLQTTSGDITLELFAKQTPLASRNFLQHCLDGYYNNTVFHRLVPGFILQGGDPTGSGSGGISAINDGEPFEDEFHSRLKYNRRGLLGMANEGKDSNASQFFFTLAATPELQGKNTMFGRVEGDTIYNLMKMADAELVEGEGSERPLYPTKITGAEVLVNPFEGMIARAQEAPRSKVATSTEKKGGKKRKKALGKNILSFGDEGEEDVAPQLKKAKVNPKFVVATSTDEPQQTQISSKSSFVGDKKPELSRNEESPVPLAASTFEVQHPSAPPAGDRMQADGSGDDEVEVVERQVPSRGAALEKTNAEISAIKHSMRRAVDKKPEIKEKPRSTLEAMIPLTSSKGRKRGGKATSDEEDAFKFFESFKQRLEELPEADEADPLVNRKDKPENGGVNGTTNGDQQSNDRGDQIAFDDEEATLCDLHFIPNCQSCKAWDDDDGEGHEDNDDSADWMAQKLSFAKDTLGKDLEWKRKMQEIEVIDPREKTREILGERRKGKEKVKAR